MEDYPDKYKECEIDVAILDTHVIAIAKAGYTGEDWSAYIGCTKGYLPNDYEGQVAEVLTNGTKLPHEVAAVLFHGFDSKFRWRP